MDPKLVHEILLAGPNRFDSLSSTSSSSSISSSSSSAMIVLPPFEEYIQELFYTDHRSSGTTTTTTTATSSSSSSSSSARSVRPEYILKRAYHDSLLETIQTKSKSYRVIMEMIQMDLYTAIRSLVPNRNDVLKDDNDTDNDNDNTNSTRKLPEYDPNDTTNALKFFFPWILRAAQTLTELESLGQVTTTYEWIERYQSIIINNNNSNNNDNNNENNTTSATTTTTLTDTIPHLEPISLIIASILYLIDKAMICQQEKDEFYLIHIIAPKLYHTGKAIEMERAYFQQRFFQNPNKNNIDKLHNQTSLWINMLLQNEQKDTNTAAATTATMDTQILQLRNNPRARLNFITKGWMNTILFQSQSQSQQNQQTTSTTTATTTTTTTNMIVLPEIFVLDVPTIHTIRSITRSAAAGCALGLLASQAAKIQNLEHILQNENEGKPLVDVMNNQQRYRNLQDYEQSVEDAVVSLAQSWSRRRHSNCHYRRCQQEHERENNVEEEQQHDHDHDQQQQPYHSMDVEQIEILRGQTRSVLRGENPVLKLLDERMRKLFCELGMEEDEEIEKEGEKENDNDNYNNNYNNNNNTYNKNSSTGENIPPVQAMKTGIGSFKNNNNHSQQQESLFITKAKKKFASRGLAFYATDLAYAAELAIKVPRLAYQLYGDTFLDPVFIHQLELQSPSASTYTSS